MGIKDTVKKQVIKQMISLLPNVSNKNLIRLTQLAEMLTKTEKDTVKAFREMIKEDHPSFKIYKKIMNDLSKNCKDKLVTNLFINGLLQSQDKRKKFEQENGFIPPFLFVISPTMRCNLRCKGCYAGEYTQKDDLSTEMVYKILDEAKEMGIGFSVISGGEPFIREDLFDIFKKYNDMYFLVYTNGTMITKEVAKKLAEVGNVAPAISVEGFKKETDERRSEGVYEKVLQAMDNLREAGVMFGFSATPTKYNSEVLMSDEFLDFYIKKGCFFGWFFQYIPIGLKPNVEMMATPEQRTKLRYRVHNDWREKKEIFVGDFWNDGCYVTGCMAGGRKYLHINCKGDIESCVFTHFAVDNIHNTTIKKALHSKFFKSIRKQQKEVKNLLTPCCIIDNPEILRNAVEESGAYPTHEGAETIIKDPKIREHLDNYSKKMKEMADPDWKNKEMYRSYRERWEKERQKEYY